MRDGIGAYLCTGNRTMLVIRRQHGTFALVGAGENYLRLVGGEGVVQSAGPCWCRDKGRRKMTTHKRVEKGLEQNRGHE